MNMTITAIDGAIPDVLRTRLVREFERDLDRIVAEKEARQARAAWIANASDDTLDNEIVHYVTGNAEVNRVALEYRFRNVPGVGGTIDRLLAQGRLTAKGPWITAG
jgi:hypothetical protein